MSKITAELIQSWRNPSQPFSCPICFDLKRRSFCAASGDSKTWYPFKHAKNRRPEVCIFELFGWFDGRCRFCWLVFEGFWLLAETHGYPRYELHDEFRHILVEAAVREEELRHLSVLYRVKPESKKYYKDLEYKWENKGWVFCLEETSTTPLAPVESFAYDLSRRKPTVVAFRSSQSPANFRECNIADQTMASRMYKCPWRSMQRPQNQYTAGMGTNPFAGDWLGWCCRSTYRNERTSG